MLNACGYIEMFRLGMRKREEALDRKRLTASMLYTVCTRLHFILFIYLQVTNELMSHAAEDAVFMHCLPRHKEEVDDEVNGDPTYM